MKRIARPRPGPYCQEDGERLSLAPVSARPGGHIGPERTVLPEAPVAQLDRALDYESRGREFESLRARQLINMKYKPFWN
jgi:hypothetical protein